MARKWTLEWIDKNAEAGPLFQIGRDVYVRERPGQAVIRLKAYESYPPDAVPAAVEAFNECAAAWGAPITFIIDPDLKKPPAVRFLFEWSRSTFARGSVERSYMKTTNTLTRWMATIVLKMFTDGSMPFEAIEGEPALQARLDQLDLTCPKEGFKLNELALQLHAGVASTLLGSLMVRLFNRGLRRRRR